MPEANDEHILQENVLWFHSVIFQGDILLSAPIESLKFSTIDSALVGSSRAQSMEVVDLEQTFALPLSDDTSI